MNQAHQTPELEVIDQVKSTAESEGAFTAAVTVHEIHTLQLALVGGGIGVAQFG